MITWFNNLHVGIKALLLVGFIASAAIGWWLVSPLFIDGPTLNEDLLDETEATILYNGTFVVIDSTHYGHGTVEIVESLDGKLSLQFRDVDLANGPALVVYLSKKSTFSGTSDDPGQYKNLGDLPGTGGNFSMNILGVSNIDEFKSVVVWCEPFSVLFTWATLSPVT